MQRISRTSFFETLEHRQLMSASTALSGTFVYLETNNPTANAVVAYSQNPKTGAISALPTYKYLTGGKGYENVGSILGPDDSDKEVIASPDGKYLFAVNQGSNSVSVFAIQPDGSLRLVHNAPFASGGTQPVSLSFSNDQLFVVNRGNSANGVVGTIAPTVVSFFVGEDGQLFKASSVTLPLNLSTAQVLASADGKFAFVDNFATPGNLGVSLADTVEPFVINGDGSLTAVPNGAAGLPSNPPLVLGLVEDPIHHIIYTGEAPSGGVATFTYSATTGKVSYVDSVASEGAATCWLNISPNGKFLYATDSASDAISVYSLANPLKPAFVQEFYLAGPTKLWHTPATSPTSQDFQFSFDPSGKYIYVVNHTTDPNFQEGNQIHTLDVAANGKLSEPTGPSQFPASLVNGVTHVDGIAVVTPAGYYGGYASSVAQVVPAAQVAPATTSVFSDDDTKLKALVDQLLDGTVS